MYREILTLWRVEYYKHLKNKGTFESNNVGVGAGANLHGDLEKVVELCREKSKKQGREPYIGKVECYDDKVELNTKSPHGGYKAQHNIPLAGVYVPWKEALQVFEEYLNCNGTNGNHFING